MDKPSESHWDTKPVASAIKFFGEMADEEQRRGLFGDDEPKGDGVNDGGNGNIHDNAEQEVTFGFPILDLTRDVAMKNISPSALPYFHDMSTEDTDSFLFEFDISVLSRSLKKIRLLPKVEDLHL